MFNKRDKTRMSITNNRANDLVFEDIYPLAKDFENINPMLFEGNASKNSLSHISATLMNLFNKAFFASINNHPQQSRASYVNLYKQLFTCLSGLNDEQAKQDGECIANYTLDYAIALQQSEKKPVAAILSDVKIKLLSNLNLFEESTAVCHKDINSYSDFFSSMAKQIKNDFVFKENNRLNIKDEYEVYPSAEVRVVTNPLLSK